MSRFIKNSLFIFNLKTNPVHFRSRALIWTKNDLFVNKWPLCVTTRDLHIGRLFGQKDVPRMPINKPECNKLNENPPPVKLTLFQRFKLMYRDYWYVLIPVHLVTSAAWFGGFYYAAKSGVDIVSCAQALNLSESFISKLKTGGNSTAGYLAISYALYKIFTPLRYTVTLGGTTLSIKYLTKHGYIKPIPKSAEIQKMFKDKKENFKEKSDAMKLSMIEKREAMKSNIMDKFTQKKSI